ncbi:D-alanyl-D-alanine carboxypeptidase family protein [Isachenkonia alkalipeptolytica]|uniref:D-alanyl-D-alanine carboxypeptidase n=1 Tax=Isachenkonia alkalipeptolytica TaxID=2565777 RepID=A0AA43XL95_9CLOT|nr:D-alanyl-D-alanine carboxypeptidase [Isachenkonia alkalipeptolytica]NBG88386.1 D-alanyl-D-alanine carboxypeptidase [Isachenkonia alkalipeptolytica]
MFDHLWKKTVIFTLSAALMLSATTGVYAVPEEESDTDDSEAEEVAIIDEEGFPIIRGEMGITIDVETGEILYAKNIDKKAYPASTSKIITGLLFAENSDKEDVLSYTENALAQPSYSLNTDYGPIPLGYEMTGKSAMEALLIYSANDVAAMVGDHVAGDGESFVQMINDRFDEMGLENTSFTNASGTHDEDHYTTAYELSVITREALSNPWVEEVLLTESVVIPTPRGTVPWENARRKVANGDPVLVKTGYTPAAGRCLVAIYERDGRKIAGIVLNSEYNHGDTMVFEDMDRIMDWSFDEAERTPYFEAGDRVDTLEVEYRPLRFFGPVHTAEVPVTIQEEVLYFENDINEEEIHVAVELKDVSPFSMDPEEPVGTASIQEREAKESYAVYPEVSRGDILSNHIGLYIGTGLGGLIGLVALAGLIGFIIRFNGRLRKKRRQYPRF